MNTSASDNAVTTAQARANVYAVLAHGLRYPGEEFLELVADDQRFAAWTEALVQTAGTGTADPIAVIRNGSAHAASGSGSTLGSLQAAHDNLFGHAVRGPCPAYESEYGRSEINQQASQLADLAGFYTAFGMAIVDTADGRPDYVSVECEFMSVLCAKEAYGCASDEQDLVDRCRSAQRAFLKDHLARWLPAFAQRIIDAREHEFYTRLGQLADRFIATEAERFGIATGPRWLELRRADHESETSISCLDSTNCGPQAGEQFTPLNMDLHKD